jgi:PilZ domain-containing protein
MNYDQHLWSFQMTLPLQKNINRRQHERKFFHHKVNWMHQSGTSTEMKALDMSPWGIFISDEDKMIREIKNNDTVTISIDIGKETFDLHAKVRWSGTSSVHYKRGFGLEFDEPSKKLAEELFLELDEQGVFFVPEE